MVEVSKEAKKQQFQLVSKHNGQHTSFIISKRRSIIGRMDSADVVVDNEAISSVHAVLEIVQGGAVVYDMNSTNGTYINGKKIVSEKIKIGDRVQFANQEFVFKDYIQQDDLPPVLDMLTPQTGSAAVVGENKKLPSAPDIEQVMPQIVYPLSQDPKAMFSEYIFEDADKIYPIFNYQVGKTAVEVIILYDDIVFSVDYLPNKDGIYSLTGFNPNRNSEVEFPYLSKTEKTPLIEIRKGEIFAFRLSDMKVMYLSDTKSSPSDSNFKLNNQDIIRFEKNGLQIFVRNVDAPPKVASPPFFRRDKSFFLVLLFALFICGGVSVFTLSYKLDEELEQEQIPERLAKVLDTPKPVIIHHKVETIKVEEKKEEKKDNQIEKPEKIQEVKEERQAGVKEAEKVQEVKQATVKDDGKRPDKLEAKKTGGGGKKATQLPTSNNTTSNGNVDTYKSFNFEGNISSTLSKGKGIKGAVAPTSSGVGSGTGAGEGEGDGTVFGGRGNVDNLKRADVSSAGSLIGSSAGKIAASKGAEGLSDKKGIINAGMPIETVILGSIDPALIRKLLADHIPQFRYCYQKELDAKENKVEFQGIVKFNFVLGASGRVVKAGVTSDSALTPQVKECVLSVLKGIPFPEPKGGGQAEINQPMNFFPKRY